MSGHFWWLVSRASGIVALCLLSASMLLGLAMAARALPARPGIKRDLTALHEQLALAALFAIGAHAVTLLGDGWLRPGLASISVPFALNYRPAFTALGIVAAYASALLGLSYYPRRRIGPRLWRRAHRFTVAAYALAVAHTLGAGSDAATWWLRVVVVGPLAAGAVLLAYRVSPASRPRMVVQSRA